MLIKSHHSINFLVLNCLISIACNASAPELVTPQTYVPNELSVNQKMLVFFEQYHMGNPKVLAAMLALIPSATIVSGMGIAIATAPLIGSVSGNTLAVTLNSAPSKILELPKLALDTDATSQPDELAPLISYDKPADGSDDFKRQAGFFGAGAATMSAVLWYIFRN